MRHILVLLALAIFANAALAQRLVTKGATDQTCYITIIDETTGLAETGVVAATSGLDLEYVRAGAAPVDLTESDLAATDSAHSDGGIKHVGGGRYRVDIPDAAFAAGANAVYVQGTCTGMKIIGETCQLTAFDLQTAVPNVTATTVGSGAISNTSFGPGAITNTAIASGAIGASQVGPDAIGASELAADALAEIATAIGNGSAFTAIPWNPAWDAEVQSEATDALNAYDPPTKAEMDTGFNATLKADVEYRVRNNSTSASTLNTFDSTP